MKAKWAGFVVLLLGAGLLSKAQAGGDAAPKPNPTTVAVLDAFKGVGPSSLAAPSLGTLARILTERKIVPGDELPSAFGPLVSELQYKAFERGEDFDSLKEPGRLIPEGTDLAGIARQVESAAGAEAGSQAKALGEALEDFHAAYQHDENTSDADVRRLSDELAKWSMTHFAYLTPAEISAVQAAHKNAQGAIQLAREAREKAAAPQASQTAGSEMIEVEPEHFVAAPPPDVRKEMEDYIPYMRRLDAAARNYKLLKDRGEQARFWRTSDDVKRAREFWNIADQAFGRLERRLKAELKGIEKVGPGPASREKLEKLKAEVIALYNWVYQFANGKDFQVPEGQRSRYAFKATIMDTDARNNGSRFNPQTGETIVNYVTKQYMGDEGAKTMLERLISDAEERIGKRDKRERDKIAPYAAALRAWQNRQIKDRQAIVPIIKLSAYQEKRLERAKASADLGYFSEVAQAVRTGSDGIASPAALAKAARRIDEAVAHSLRMASFLWGMAAILGMPAAALAVRLAGYSAPAALAGFSVLAVLALRAFVRLERWRGAYRRLVTLDRVHRVK